jgi:predicted nucleic acid-binding protein
MSNPGYSRQVHFTPSVLIANLRAFVSQTDHEFWPDSLSLRQEPHFDSSYLHSSRRITDIYLLGLAVNHGGRLATFDQSVPLSPVLQAGSPHLCVI